jgi:hypothetical protein
LLKLDVEQLKEAVAAPPQSNAGRVGDGRNRALVAKAPDGFRESLARFRADSTKKRHPGGLTNPLGGCRVVQSRASSARSTVLSRHDRPPVEWHPGELYPRVGFIVTNLSRPADRVVTYTTSGRRPSTIFRPRSDGVTGYVTSSMGLQRRCVTA